MIEGLAVAVEDFTQAVEEARAATTLVKTNWL